MFYYVNSYCKINTVANATLNPGQKEDLAPFEVVNGQVLHVYVEGWPRVLYELEDTRGRIVDSKLVSGTKDFFTQFIARGWYRVKLSCQMFHPNLPSNCRGYVTVSQYL